MPAAGGRAIILGMELRQLEYFLTVAEELHFGKAAERVHISQPPLSRQIMELEEELGTKLFDRTTRGVKLTSAGEYLKVEARNYLSRGELIKERVRGMGSASERRVRLGFVSSALYSFLPGLLAGLSRDMPGLSFDLFELCSDDQVKAIASGKLDLGFVRSWSRESGVDFVPLVEEALSVVFGPTLSPGLGADPSLADFRFLPFIALTESCAPILAEVSNRLCVRSGFKPVPAYTADQFDIALRLAAAGVGWSILPSLVYRDARLDLRSAELRDAPEKLVIGLASRVDEEDGRITELASYLREVFAGSRPLPAAPGIRA